MMQLVVLVGILQRNCTFTTTMHIHFFKKRIEEEAPVVVAMDYDTVRRDAVDTVQA